MIRSTFAGFTTAQLGMAASQRSLDVVGQNIANINTPGYTRQRLDIASLNLQKGDYSNSKSMIKIGFGVEMTGISQMRDPFLDAQYRSQICKLGTSDAHAASFEKLTPVFDEATMEGVRAAFISITSSLSTLSTQVGNQENDTMVRSDMQILLNLFRENAVKLQDVRNDMQESFKTTDIADVNQLLENIAELNVNIKNSQVLGNPALELQDQRNSLLDELASYLPISVKYSDQQIGPGVSVEVLNVDFVDTKGVKHSLIADERHGRFDADIKGQPIGLTLVEAKGKTTDITEDLLGSGTIKGTLDFLNKSGSFDNTDFKGLGYYEKALDSLVATFADAFNKLNVVKDANGDPVPNKANPLFEQIDKTKPFSATNIKIADGWADGSYGITASDKYIVTNTETGTTANENILNMIKLLEDKTTTFSVPNCPNPGGTGTRSVKFYTGTFHDCFANLEATLGTDYKSENTMLTNQITILNQTSNSRDAVSGVQLDEEGMDLLHYNQSYAAAARLMTTLDEALDKLINGTGVVGR